MNEAHVATASPEGSVAFPSAGSSPPFAESPPENWVYPKPPPADAPSWFMQLPEDRRSWWDPGDGGPVVYHRLGPPLRYPPPRSEHSFECLFDEATCPDVLTCPELGQFATLPDRVAWDQRFRAGELKGAQATELLAKAVGVGADSAAAPAEQQDAAPSRLHYLTPEELFRGGEAFKPVVEDLAYEGLRTLVVGLSKAGKSYLTWAKLTSLCQHGQRVLYLSEEPRPALMDKVTKFGLEPALREGLLRIAPRWHEAIRSKSWEDLAADIAADAASQGFALVVVDTIRPWLNLDGEDSNSADRIGRAMDLLTPVCSTGAAVVALHQAPWSGKRARGSTELHAVSDLIFHVEGENDGPRTIKYVGGRVEGIPTTQTFRWTEGRGEDLGAMRHDKAERLDAILRILEHADEPLTAQAVADEIDRALATTQRHLAELEKKDLAVRRHGAAILSGGSEPDKWSRAGMFARLLPEEH